MNTPSSVPTRQGYFKPLTGLRAAAAALVYMIHYNPLANTGAPFFAKEVFYQLYTGVTIFFVLSGFLITYRYYGKVELSQAWFRKYMVGRIARIYPLYFILTCVTFIVYWQHLQPITNALGVLVTNLTFLRGYSNALKLSLVAQGWSLTVEETFYLFAPLLLLCLSRYRLITYPIMGLLLLCTGIALVELIHGRFMNFFLNYNFLFGWTFFGRFFEFFAGSFLAWMLLKSKLPYIPRVPLTYLSILAFAIVLILLTQIRIIQLPLHTPYQVNSLDTMWGIVVNNIILPPIIAIFLWGIIVEDTYVSRSLSTPIADLLGKSSYAFYLIHHGIVHELLDSLFDTSHFVGYTVVLALLIGLSIVLLSMWRSLLIIY